MQCAYPPRAGANTRATWEDAPAEGYVADCCAEATGVTGSEREGQ